MQLKSATAIIGLAVSASIARAETGWSVDAGAVRTDNATLATTGAVKDTVESVGGAIAWEDKQGALQASLNGSGGLLHYTQGTYDDDFIGRIAGSASIRLLPERFNWTATENFGQIAADPFAPETPQNRQQVNVFESGPDLHVRIAPQTSLDVTGRYSDTRFQDSTQIDTRSWGGSLGLSREVARASSLGVYLSQNRYSYRSVNGVKAPLYDQQAAWLAWQSVTPRQTLDADLGVNRIHSGGSSQSRPKASLGWMRRFQPSWLFNLHLAAEYQNAGQQFTAGNASNVGITNQPATINRGDLTIAFERPRTTFSASGGLGKVNYIGSKALNEDTWFADVQFSRRFLPRLKLFLHYRIDRRDYQENPIGHIRQETGTAGLDVSLARTLFLTLGYSRVNSEGDTTQFQYLNNLLSLRLSWRGGKTAAPRTFDF